MRPAIIIPVLLLAALDPAWGGSPDQVHVTWQNDPRTSMTVSWRTATPQPSIVEYGLDESYGSRVTGVGGTLHHVEVSALSPGKLYHLRCGSPDGWSDDVQIRTASESAEAFTFAALGDSRTNMNMWRKVSDATAGADPLFCIHTGDLVESGDVEKQWELWFASGSRLLSSTVFMPSLGNHENNAYNYFEHFSLPGAEQWYSFDYGNVHFVALTTENDMYGAQREWLEDDLASTNATWKIAFYHKPMYSVGSHGSTLSVQRAWGDLLDRYHVDIVFNGHDHLYARTLPIAQGALADSPDHGTIHIVTGGAGAGLHSVEEPHHEWLAKAFSDYHYLLVTIEGSHLYMETRAADNSVLDTLEINKTLYPDLTVSSLATLPAVPLPGVKADVIVRVQNRGRAASGTSTMTLLCEEDATKTIPLPSMGPGESHEVTIPWVPDEGVYNLSVQIDWNRAVDEGPMEWNNDAEISVVVTTPKPDLLPVSIEVDGGDLLAGERARLVAGLRNQGNADSPPFQASLLIGETLFTSEVPPLPAGALTEIVLAEVELPPGDWSALLTVDTEDVIGELREENNDMTLSIPVRDFQRFGGAYLPRGAVEGEPIVILYDDVEGTLPDSSQRCAIQWGVNGWIAPSLRPPGTAMAGSTTETIMQRSIDGRWMVAIPTDASVERVDLRFRDGQIIGDWIDDNSGSDWMVPTRGWATGMVSDLREALVEANEQELDVSSFGPILQSGEAALAAGDYLLTIQLVGNSTATIRREMALTQYAMVEALYQESLSEGISVPRAEAYLKAASGSIEGGNYHAAQGYLDNVIKMIEAAREEIHEEMGFGLGVLLCLLALQHMRRAVEQERMGKSQAPATPM